MRRNYTIRLDEDTLEALALLAESTHLTAAEVVRHAIDTLLNHPETLEPLLTTEDERSPQQAANWRRDYQQLTDPGKVNALLVKSSPPMPY
jgi:hypothetical protein